MPEGCVGGRSGRVSGHAALGANGVFSLEPWTPLAYIAKVARRFITVAETPLFSRQAREVWDDAELAAFIDFIARNPEERGPDPRNRRCSKDPMGAARKRQTRRRAGDLLLP
jgi:hypothetical protein